LACEYQTNIHHRHSEVFGATNTIEGLDAVGEIVELGPGVTDFEIGQVVLTITRGIGAGMYFIPKITANILNNLLLIHPNSLLRRQPRVLPRQLKDLLGFRRNET
jgi:NADPH:quinone reductase-like Zn-dependent oxidoreductase